MKKISILGSTGSIGTQTLDVIRHFPQHFSVVGLSAGKNIELLKAQLLEFEPALVSVISEEDAHLIQDFITFHKLKTDVYYGKKGLNTIASQPVDLLIVAIVGTTSIEATYNAIQCGTHIGLACKEVLVSAGDIIMAEAKKNKVHVLPIDSEHAALFQCLEGFKKKDVSRLILTASGGPFWNKNIDPATITKEEALNHPNWSMGQKITIDSATLMNKGLEVIEAHHLFDIPYEQIDVVIHPQSIIHSLVEYKDGNILAQLGLPDMRIPIQFVLTYPEKKEAPWPKTNFFELQSLSFHKPDFTRFPLCKLAFDAGKKGSTYPVVMNAANEIAVYRFLQGELTFTGISNIIHQEVDQHTPLQNPSIRDIIELDEEIKTKVSHALLT